MKLFIVIAGTAMLGGCAASMQHPVNSLAEQKLDAANCKAEAAGSNTAGCIASQAKAKSKPKIDAFPFEIG